MRHDVVVIGSGIVGLSTARALLRRSPGLAVAVLDKELAVAAHQTGRNSGVIHSGLYYAPGSLKARYAVEGGAAMVRYAEEHGIPHRVTGKLVVAVDAAEVPRLEALHQRGLANGLAVTRLSPGEVAEREPHIRSLAALHVPSTGIVDYAAVAASYADEVRAAGGEIHLGSAVRGVTETADGVSVETSTGDVRARLLVNCAGLQSDRVARLAGVDPGVRIVPFRGEYAELRPERWNLVNGLVYPVPDPAFPFLGVHLTTMIHGGVHVGPNAVLALAREGYRRSAVDLGDVREVLGYPGFRALARRHWRPGLGEMHRSFSKRAFIRALRRLLPAATAEDLVPAEPGIRAQAVLPDGRLVDDFLIREDRRSVHVLNAPSPAATASLPIGDHVAGLALQHLV